MKQIQAKYSKKSMHLFGTSKKYPEEGVWYDQQETKDTPMVMEDDEADEYVVQWNQHKHFGVTLRAVKIEGESKDG